MSHLSKGSEWDRWDLHIHTPETATNDGYTSWDEFYQTIEGQNDVSVLGITDYCTIDNYEKVLAHKQNGNLSNIDLVIPNIEFRIAPPNDKSKFVNIHILVSPHDNTHIDEIKSALSRLSWEYNDCKYSCLKPDLIKLGKAFDSSLTSYKSALEQGCLQFKPDFGEFRKWYRSEGWLSRNSIIVVAAGKDGISGFDTAGGYSGLREEISRFSDAIFSGNPNDVNFWIGNRKEEDLEILQKLGGFRPCIHGSDAHKASELFFPDANRFCWIKADKTFEGLRQIVFEPETRVHIGPTKPLFHDKSKVLSEIQLSGTSGWFSEEKIPLNSGLVSIIGQKGSGKSALAELVAYGANALDENEDGSFIRRAFTHLEKLNIKLTWADGRIEERKIGDPLREYIGVRYLSQKFVEKLCAEDQIGNELINEIENVVFNYIPATETLGASSFKELRAIKTEAINDEYARLQSDIKKSISYEIDLRKQLEELPLKRNRITEIDKEVSGLKAQLPTISGDGSEQVDQNRSQDLRTSISNIETKISSNNEKIVKLENAKSKVESVRSQLANINSEIEAYLTNLGFSGVEVALYKVGFMGDFAAIIPTKITALQSLNLELQGSLEAPAAGTLRNMQAELDALLKKDTADKALKNRINAIQIKILALESEKTRIVNEINNLESNKDEKLAKAREGIFNNYRDYFVVLNKEKEILKSLYEPVSHHINKDTSSSQEKALQFAIKVSTDVKAWLERGTQLLDSRRRLPFQDLYGVEKHIVQNLEPAWQSGNVEKIIDEIIKFVDEFRTIRPQEYLRSSIGISDLLDWIFEVGHISLNYGLKYNNIPLEKLSPGTKGIVLLILYLGIDNGDTRPLIIDQPDDNLDNESIYNLLTKYFRDAKLRRQVILITHNPNLVVNSDSEQIIIAEAKIRESGLPEISYRAGSIEDNRNGDLSIRLGICRILEGGLEAFRKREARY